MRRFIATFFLILYLYNFAGYLAVFFLLMHRAHYEAKEMIKSKLPDSELVRLSFHTSSLQNRSCPIQWIEENEFRYGGAMYDVVRTRTSGDSTYLLCINDLQEERLFANLDRQVQREMNDSRRLSSLDSFKDLFKDSYHNPLDALVRLTLLGRCIDLAFQGLIFIAVNAPFHPPNNPAL